MTTLPRRTAWPQLQLKEAEEKPRPVADRRARTRPYSKRERQLPQVAGDANALMQIARPGGVATRRSDINKMERL
jgi:hypothetical protein